MKKIISIMILICPLILSGCKNSTDKTYSPLDSLKEYNTFEISTNAMDSNPLIYISDNYSCELKNNNLAIYKNKKEYSTIEYVGNFEVTDLGHANIFEKNDELIFLTKTENTSYLNFYSSNKEYSYVELSLDKDCINTYLYVSNDIYLLNTFWNKTEILSYDVNSKNVAEITKIDYVVKECVQYLYFDGEKVIVQDYSQKYTNTYISKEIKETKLSINIPTYFYGGIYHTTMEFSANNPVFISEAKYYNINYNYLKGDVLFYDKDSKNYHLNISSININKTGKRYLASVNNIIDTYGTYDYETFGYKHGNTCYYVLYSEENNEDSSFPKLIMIKLSPDGKIEYGILNDFNVLYFYQYSNYIVFKNEEQTLYYELK